MPARLSRGAPGQRAAGVRDLDGAVRLVAVEEGVDLAEELVAAGDAPRHVGVGGDPAPESFAVEELRVVERGDAEPGDRGALAQHVRRIAAEELRVFLRPGAQER